MPPKSAGQSVQSGQSGFFRGNTATTLDERVSATRLPELPRSTIDETAFQGGGSYRASQAARRTLSSFNTNPTFDPSKLESQSSAYDQQQDQTDKTLQQFFGGYLVRSLNFGDYPAVFF